jgi:hypothetical protein
MAMPPRVKFNRFLDDSWGEGRLSGLRIMGV